MPTFEFTDAVIEINGQRLSGLEGIAYFQGGRPDPSPARLEYLRHRAQKPRTSWQRLLDDPD